MCVCVKHKLSDIQRMHACHACAHGKWLNYRLFILRAPHLCDGKALFTVRAHDDKNARKSTVYRVHDQQVTQESLANAKVNARHAYVIA